MLDQIDDTIVAVSSASGRSPVGIIRLTGSQSISIVEEITNLAGGCCLRDVSGSTRIEGAIAIGADADVPATFYVFRHPQSYTREDTVEIYTIGSPPLLELLRKRMIALGARAAEAGEFTARAFLNGAMNLAQAEAVGALIRAQSDTQLRASRRAMDGEFTRAISSVRDGLAELLALVEADIDFAEEPIEFITPHDVRRRLGEVAQTLSRLKAGSIAEEQLDQLPHVLLFGAPNAGKSSLMNQLTGTSRSICAAVAGTTRDILSAPMRIGRGEAILLDAAGVDQSPDEVISAAREMVLATAERVDMICIVLDVTQPVDEHVVSLARSLDTAGIVVVANKTDLLEQTSLASDGASPPGHTSTTENVRESNSADEPGTASQRESLAHHERGSPSQSRRLMCDVVAELEELSIGAVCSVSAKTGAGMDALRDHLCDALSEQPSIVATEVVALNMRQRAAIAEAAEAICRATEIIQQAAETVDCADILAFELREALDLLGQVTGDVTTEDLLGQVFAKFCIGK